MIKRMEPEGRRRQLLQVALDLAVHHGYRHITRADIATAAGCSPALINVYWSTVEELRATVLRAAIRRGVLPVLSQGLAARDPQALSAPVELQRQAANWMVVE